MVECYQVYRLSSCLEEDYESIIIDEPLHQQNHRRTTTDETFRVS